jgi:hypothetical protein
VARCALCMRPESPAVTAADHSAGARRAALRQPVPSPPPATHCTHAAAVQAHTLLCLAADRRLLAAPAAAERCNSGSLGPLMCLPLGSGAPPVLVHRQCALWSPGAYEQDMRLVGGEEALCRGRATTWVPRGAAGRGFVGAAGGLQGGCRGAAGGGGEALPPASATALRAAPWMPCRPAGHCAGRWRRLPLAAGVRAMGRGAARGAGFSSACPARPPARRRCECCGAPGATVACMSHGCCATFHLPCARDAGCFLQVGPPPASSPPSPAACAPPPAAGRGQPASRHSHRRHGPLPLTAARPPARPLPGAPQRDLLPAAPPAPPPPPTPAPAPAGARALWQPGGARGPPALLRARRLAPGRAQPRAAVRVRQRAGQRGGGRGGGGCAAAG